MNFRTSRQARSLAFRMVALLVPAAMIITGLGAAPAQATGGDPPVSTPTWDPPPPIPDDNCGTKWDRYKLTEQNETAWRVNGESRSAGVWYSTGGAATVTVVAKNYSDPDKTFTLTFGTEPDSTCVEAPDTVQLTATGCDPGTGRIQVVVTLTNTPDTSGWSRTAGAVVWLMRWDAGSTVFPYFPSEIPDGSSASVKSISDAEVGAGVINGFPHMMPGTYEVRLEADGNPNKTLPQTLFVPDLCGRLGVPPDDPSGLGGTVDNGKPGMGDDGDLGIGGADFTKHMPRVKIKQKRHIIRVTLKNRAKVTARYRVVIRPAKGKVTCRQPVVKAGKGRVIKRRHFRGPGRVRVVAKAGGQKYVWRKRLVRHSR